MKDLHTTHTILQTNIAILKDKIKNASRSIPTFQIMLWRQELHEANVKLQSFK